MSRNRRHPSLHAAPDGKIALVNGTLINPGTANIVPNALVIMEGDHVNGVGDQATAFSTKGAQIVDCKRAGEMVARREA